MRAGVASFPAPSLMFLSMHHCLIQQDLNRFLLAFFKI
jgi:hypothetical protein